MQAAVSEHMLTSCALRVRQVRRRHRELCVALLRVMRRVDLLEGRFAAANGVWAGGQARGAAADLARQLAQLESQLAPGRSGEAPCTIRAAQPLDNRVDPLLQSVDWLVLSAVSVPLSPCPCLLQACRVANKEAVGFCRCRTKTCVL